MTDDVFKQISSNATYSPKDIYQRREPDEPPPLPPTTMTTKKNNHWYLLIGFVN